MIKWISYLFVTAIISLIAIRWTEPSIDNPTLSYVEPIDLPAGLDTLNSDDVTFTISGTWTDTVTTNDLGEVK